jgi:uncharacterized repeat protein (TIGR01451 family)
MRHRPGVVAALVAAFCLTAAPSALAANTADLQIFKSGRPDPVAAGQYVSYEIVVHNAGPDAANGVVVTDPLPAGTQFVSATFGCTYAAPPTHKVTCPLGTIANGDDVGLEIVVRLTNFSFHGLISNTATVATPDTDPMGPNSSTFKSNVYNDSHDHHVTPSDAEQFVDWNAGETKSVNLTCPKAGNAVDGSLTIDNVDQDTGTLRSVVVTESYAKADGSWQITATNTATGRAQGHAHIACMPLYTENATGDNHAHAINVYAPLTYAVPVTPGHYDIPISCNAPDVVGAAPGFQLSPGTAAELVRSESAFVGGNPGWSFGFDVTAPGTITVSVRCLDRYVGVNGGHTHELWLSHPDLVATVAPDPAGKTVNIDCSDEAKGIVATYNLPPGVHMMGHQPQIKRRSFKLLNTTNAPIDVHVDLLCVGDRTGTDPPPKAGPASVASSATPAKSGASVPVALTCPAGGCGGSVELTANVSGSRAVAAAVRVIGRATFKSHVRGRVVAKVTIDKRYRAAVRNHKIKTVTAVVRQDSGKVAKTQKIRLKRRT